MKDEPDTAELENRIDKLESTIQKMMPSRRDALKMGGAALVGGAAMSGTASAGTNQVGTIGSQASPVDLESEDINNSDTVTTQNIDISRNVNGADTSTAAAGQALTSNGTGGLSFATVGGGIPPNFSYVNETSNRSFGTSFTNNSGKALYVSVTSSISSGSIIKNFVVNGQLISRAVHFNEPNQLKVTVQGFVPDGAFYKVDEFDGSASLDNWFEAEM